jgi:MFS family permease
VVLPLLVVVGVVGIIGFVAIQTVMQMATEDAFRGRVFGAFGTTVALLMFAGSGLGGLLADQLGSPALVAASGGIYLLAGVAGAVWLAAPLRKMQAAASAA